jgi:hypothetical protein
MTLAGMPSETWGMGHTRRYLPSMCIAWAQSRGTRHGCQQTYPTKRTAERAEDDARDALYELAERGTTVMQFWTEWTTDPLWARPAESTNLHRTERTRAFAETYGERPLRAINAVVVAEWLKGGRKLGTSTTCARCSTTPAASRPANSSTPTRSPGSGYGAAQAASTSSRPHAARSPG